MVFESVLTQVLNRVLGDYVENLDTNQLRIGIWGGDVQLTNLYLKQSALSDLDLPIQTVCGKIGKLVLKIPWKNLYGAAFVINVEDIYLLATPNQQVKYDPIKEEAQLHEVKMDELKKIEEAKKKAMTAKESVQKTDFTFAEKLITQIVKNLQLNIKNIHIRYEDKVTLPNFPFAMGFTLSELNVVSTNEQWQPAITKEQISKIFKIVQLEAFSVYWNCATKLYADLDCTNAIDRLVEEIAKKEFEPEGYNYILGPINASAKCILNQKPENDEPAYSRPMIDFNFEMEKLFVGITKAQYQNIIALFDSMSIMMKGEPFRKYRPNVPSYKGHYKEWWHFAYTCVLEGEVKRKRQNWDWKHIVEHRQLCNKYGQAYQNVLRTNAASDKIVMGELEKKLDLFNLVLIRQRIELETKRLEKLQKESEKATWFGWMWGSTKKNSTELEESTAIMRQFEEAMTPAEKAKLYEAIGYQENMVRVEYPDWYVDKTVTFFLHTLEVEVKDDDSNALRVLIAELKGVKCVLDTREAANAIKAHVKIVELITYGLEQDDFIPHVVTSETGGGDTALLEINFEINPIDRSCDQRLHVVAQPVKVVFDAETMIKIIDVFKVPPSTYLEEVSAAATDQLSSFRESSATGLQHMIEKHGHLDLKVDLHAPIVLIPFGGKYTGCEHLIILNLGNLKIHSKRRSETQADIRQMVQEGLEQSEILHEMLDRCYDKFNLEFTNLQLVLSEGAENWKKYLDDPGKTDKHILQPVSVNLSLYKCLISDDKRLPMIKIGAELPSIEINISNARLVLLYSFINSIPFPEVEEVEKDISVDENMFNIQNPKSFIKDIEIPQQKLKHAHDVSMIDDNEPESAQYKLVDGNFVIKELKVNIYNQEDTSVPGDKIISFSADRLECVTEINRFSTTISLKLGKITLEQFMESQTFYVIQTIPLSEEDECLVNVMFRLADRKSPDFHTVHQSCESRMVLNFATLWIHLHQEALLSLMQLATKLQSDIEEINIDEERRKHQVNMLIRRSSTISRLSSSIPNLDMIFERKKIKKYSSYVDSIKFKLVAQMKELTVKFSNDVRNLSQCAIEGVSVNILMKDTYTQINGLLQQIVVIDLNPNTIHNMILSVEEKQALSVQLLIRNKDPDDEDDKNDDIEIKATMGGLKVVFLNYFLTTMLGFLDNFQTAQETIKEAGQQAALTATKNVQDAYQSAMKIKLDINIKAPNIIIPVNSQSLNALYFDLGFMTLTNLIHKLNIDQENNRNILIDNLKMDLTDVKVSRVRLNTKNEFEKECIILDPLTFKLHIKRNLSSWYRSVPDIDISGNLPYIKLDLSEADVCMILNTLKGNLMENNQEIEKKTLPAEHQQKKNGHHSSFLTDMKSSEPQTMNTFLRFTFGMDELMITLYLGGSENLDNESAIRDSKLCLARFSLIGLSVKGRMLSDQSISTSILLVNCLLDDMRYGREDKITRLIERSPDLQPVSSKADSSMPIKSMMDITFQMKDNQMFADVRIFSFTVIISVEYLLQIQEFVTNATAQLPTSQPAKNVSTGGTGGSKHEQISSPPESSNMTINLKIEKPDIILVENIDLIDTGAVVLHNEVQLKYRCSDAHQVINGCIKDLQIYTCNFNPARRQQTMYNILHPVTISIAGSTPKNKGLHLEVIVTAFHLSISPATISMANNILKTLGGGAKKLEGEILAQYQYLELWKPQRYDPQNFWFLKTEVGHDALMEIGAVTKLESGPSTEQTDVFDELCIVAIPSVVLTVEAGIGGKTLPMLLMDCSFNGNVRNWSSQLMVDANLNLVMGYYNNKLALWEPLIEPVEVIKNNARTLVPWELKFELSVNTQEEGLVMSPTEDDISSKLQTVTNIDITSDSNLELTITKTALEVFTSLSNLFSTAMERHDSVMAKSISTFKFVNASGLEVTLLIQKGSFELVDKKAPEVVLENMAEIYLSLRDTGAPKRTHLIEEFNSSNQSVVTRMLSIKINDTSSCLELPVVRADKRFFMLNYRGDSKDNWGLISDIKVDDGVTIVTLRSILQIYNHFEMPVEVYYMTPKSEMVERIGIIEPGKTFNVPIFAVYCDQFLFGIADYKISSSSYIWKELQSAGTQSKIVQCWPKTTKNGTQPISIKVLGEMEQVYFESTTRHTVSSRCYNISLMPTVVLKNCLPMKIVCAVINHNYEFIVEPGETLQLPNVNPGQSSLVLRLDNYLERTWSCRQEIKAENEEFAIWTFTSHESEEKIQLNLGLHSLISKGTTVCSLYCPFWMLNKTGLMLTYKASEDSASFIHHPADYKNPILFTFSGKGFFSKKKAMIKIGPGTWSDKFSLDVAGSSGVVSCKTEDHIFPIGVNNELTYNGLTKKITFTPYYVIINNCSFAIECQESNRPADGWVKVDSESCSAHWPRTDLDDKLIRLRIIGTTEATKPFLYTESHTTLLKLENKYGGVNVDVQVTESAIYINIAAYEEGMAPVQIYNHTRYAMNFWEKQTSILRVVEPIHSMFYTWENPAGSRVLVWETGQQNEMENDLRKDGAGEYEVGKNYKVYWVSFLNGMQRVLIFTDDFLVAQNVQSAKNLQFIEQEITVSLHGIGLCLINNEQRLTVMYMGIHSSGVIWEQRKMTGMRFKRFTDAESQALENAYQQYLIKPTDSSGIFLIANKIEIDFTKNLMLRPNKRVLRRNFQCGLWYQQKSSQTQFQMHGKINRLQIDNQLNDCVFPIVLYPVPPPKSVAIDSGTKPFAEISIVQLLLKNTQIKQFKYFKVLIQEFHIKVDLGFINALVDVVSIAQATEKYERDRFLKDIELAEDELYSHVSSKSLQEQKSFYDLLHFSPLKIHISFSLSARHSGTSSSTPAFLNILLQGVGVTITDMQDVVFKLAFFEREYTFLTQQQLITEATSHYVGQSIKQLYVLVLGLDVIGNPYGLVLGITKGVEDLFYEPFQGAIQGPGEFAEGVCLGVRSLFGHTVGGAAGAVSRITGAMGKGIAVLTFDEDYQRKRRDQINKKPSTVQEGIARSSKGLVMGVFDGVTGVFTKPISGAKEEGVGGFFKGLGKGAVGLVARPTSGVIDFASGSLDAVKRATELGEETMRLRPPRHILPDGIVKPYNRQEAEGNKLMLELEKGKFARTDNYVFHQIVIDHKEILLLTDQRIAYAIHNDMFGSWQLEWSITWNDFTHPAKVVTKGILIPNIDKKKKLGLFGSNDNGKIVLIGDPKAKEIVCEKIESLRGNP